MALSRLFMGAACLAVALAGCGEPSDANVDARQSTDVWLQTMEVGSREFYAAREAVIAAAGIEPGARVADIGAGTGLYSLLFAREVGPQGAVFAIDIEPRFLNLINQRADDLDLDNVTAVLGRPDSIALPPGSVDVAFICDTYSYFEDPAAMMASVHAALRPGGRLYVLDFDLPKGGAPSPSVQHVRLGRDGVGAEIASFGFSAPQAIAVEGLVETYMLQFTKP